MLTHVVGPPTPTMTLIYHTLTFVVVNDHTMVCYGFDIVSVAALNDLRDHAAS